MGLAGSSRLAATVVGRVPLGLFNQWVWLKAVKHNLPPRRMVRIRLKEKAHEKVD